ncbi:trypsin-like peptidase domain-containing protein [Psychrobacillus sp. NPDC058041]|uniref:trypsin-like peptidase domain-containing protein n=1 Tax=Psychrobacillus sp. NPDC058041 TaxID=3346310 RepID=UPI0036DB4714
MYCDQCGWKNEEGANFCSNCGLRFKENRSRYKFNAVLNVSLVILVGIGCLFYSVLDGVGKSALSNVAEAVSKNPVDEGSKKDKVQIIKESQSRVFSIFTEDGFGSGFLFDGKGRVVTNAHVLDGNTEVTVRDWLGHETTGQVIGISRFYDIALIQVDDYIGEKPLEKGNYFLDVGSEVIAFGTPQGFENSASIGYVTGRSRSIDVVETGYYYDSLYQIDAQISPGSSGGPLMDVKTGKVIGINTASLIDDESISFSMPIPTMLPLLIKWAKYPMSPEQVLKIMPHEESVTHDYEKADNAIGDKFYLEEFSLTNFVQEFRCSFETAVEYEDFTFIEDMLKPDSAAYQKMDDYIKDIMGKDIKLKLTSTKVTGLEIKDDHAIVSTNEVFDLINAGGRRDTYRIDREYSIVLDEYGYYMISEMSGY